MNLGRLVTFELTFRCGKGKRQMKYLAWIFKSMEKLPESVQHSAIHLLYFALLLGTLSTVCITYIICHH